MIIDIVIFFLTYEAFNEDPESSALGITGIDFF